MFGLGLCAGRAKAERRRATRRAGLRRRIDAEAGEDFQRLRPTQCSVDALHFRDAHARIFFAVHQQRGATHGRGVTHRIVREALLAALLSAPEHEQFRKRPRRHAHGVETMPHRREQAVERTFQNHRIRLHAECMYRAQARHRAHRRPVEHARASGTSRAASANAARTSSASCQPMLVVSPAEPPLP